MIVLNIDHKNRARNSQIYFNPELEYHEVPEVSSYVLITYSADWKDDECYALASPLTCPREGDWLGGEVYRYY